MLPAFLYYMPNCCLNFFSLNNNLLPQMIKTAYYLCYSKSQNSPCLLIHIYIYLLFIVIKVIEEKMFRFYYAFASICNYQSNVIYLTRNIIECECNAAAFAHINALIILWHSCLPTLFPKHPNYTIDFKILYYLYYICSKLLIIRSI